MPASQIYPVVNTIAKNLQGSNQTVVDPSGFAVFASNTINGSLEPVYSTIYNVIGRTLIAIDEAGQGQEMYIKINTVFLYISSFTIISFKYIPTIFIGFIIHLPSYFKLFSISSIFSNTTAFNPTSFAATTFFSLSSKKIVSSLFRLNLFNISLYISGFGFTICS